MFNLLSQNFKLEIKKEYMIRRLIMCLIFIFAIQISFIIFILPTWISSFYKERVISIESNRLNENLSDSSVESVVEKIVGINKKLAIINTSLKYPGITIFIDESLDKKIPGIYLDQFSVSLGAENQYNFVIGGVASTREGLVAYVENLKKSDLFSEVNLPISNLAKDKNIDFSIDIKIKKDE